ncbi:MAG: hypothetical protein IKU15_00865 [Clostridia bacterium]|nr:hypothetical protein [Clostridia bacterium]
MMHYFGELLSKSVSKIKSIIAYNKGMSDKKLGNSCPRICWNCKHWTRSGGHGSNDWGFCEFISGYNLIDSEHTCEKFEEK